MQKNSALHLFSLNALALSLALAFGPAHAQSTQADLVKKLDALASEIDKLKAELQQLKTKQDETPAAIAASTKAATTAATTAATSAATTAATTAATAAATAAVASGGSGLSATRLTGYGEIAYTRPRRESKNSQADVGRFVIGFQHRFDDRTKVVGELEVEHAVTSATDRGEVAVEQVVIEHKFNDTFGGRAGLFLIPIGLINQSHEPTAYYGNFRPMVEMAIIPSTLREIGLQAFGEHDNGISWSAGLSTGPDLTKWDPLSAEGVESPLRSVHQEGQLAKARNLSLFGAVDWRGIPGLRVGAALITGKTGQGQSDFAARNARYTLWDVHTNWTPGAWDLTALYARGTITGASKLNATFGPGAAPVPSLFDGFYAQAAYKFRLVDDYTLSPFVRYDIINTGRDFDGVAVQRYRTEGIATVGVNFNISPSIVFKADYQRHRVVKDNDRFSLGVGYSF